MMSGKESGAGFDNGKSEGSMDKVSQARALG